MPTPVEVLTTIENTLVTAGCIKGFDLPRINVNPLEMTFGVTLNNGTKLPLKCRHELYNNVLIFTDGACVGMQVELREKLRKTVVRGRQVVPVTAAIKNLSDYFQSLEPASA
jgi:hypothetical protein